MKDYINKKLGEFQFYRLLQQLSLNDLFWEFVVVSFYPSAMRDEKSVYPRIETGYAYTTGVNDENVKNFKGGVFTQECATLKIKYYIPKILMVQHLPVKKTENNCEIIRMRNGFLIDTLFC